MAQEILIVDDDPDLVAVVSIALKAEGYEVSSAGNRQAARERILQKPPDLILLDVMMNTQTDGFDLAYELRGDPATRHIPIVMLTAMSQSPDYVETFQHITDRPWPVNIFLEKPIPPRKLIETVRQILK